MENWRLKLTSAKVEVEVEAELGKSLFRHENAKLLLFKLYNLCFSCGLNPTRVG